MSVKGLVLKSRNYIGSAQPPATVLEDESRFGNDTTLFAADNPDWVQLPSGLWHLDYDGDGDIAYIADNPSLQSVSKTMSALIWVNAAVLNNKAIFCQWDDTGNQRGWLIYSDTGGGNKFRVLITDDGGWNVGRRKVFASSIVVFNSAWHLIGFTWNNGTLLLYVDGVVDTSPTKTIDEAITDIHKSTANLSLGAHYASSSAAGHFTGKLTSPQIWDYALSAEEIAAIYQKERHWFGV